MSPPTPGAEYKASWNGRVFQRHDLAGSPGCQCVDSVAAPSRTAVVDRRLEGSFAWPEQGAIAFEIPPN
jgi:hypothetical protein